MNKVLKKYQDRLNDVNRRNRSIRLSRIIKKKVFDLSDLKKIDENIPLKVINAIIHNNRKVNLLNTNVENKDEETVLRSILYLKRDIDFILNEKGYFECYLGYPFIQGNFQDGSFFRCPIMLYPVKIENNRQTKKLELCPLEDSQPIINKTFFLAFNKYNQGTRSVNLEELEEFQNLDRNEIFPKIIDFFKTLNVNIINDNFSDDKIDSLKPLKQNEMPDDLIGIIELLSLAVIGQFNQLNSSLNKDYENILANGG
ncbi:MAG: DUF4011 domain-containing protein, partial [Nanoarchaeota archaeon]|nr:DUF4011 domain-containing protein [Nanoarchaeota archaeon]